VAATVTPSGVIFLVEGVVVVLSALLEFLQGFGFDAFVAVVG
jgi:hypothetical protein